MLGIESSWRWLAAMCFLFFQRVNRISIFWQIQQGLNRADKRLNWIPAFAGMTKAGG